MGANMERLKLVQQIYARLARLEDSMEEARIADRPIDEIEKEMKALRLKLQDVMNSPCPIFKQDVGDV
jgi:uncharacterized membrane protein YjjP (DUF1212 family)